MVVVVVVFVVVVVVEIVVVPTRCVIITGTSNFHGLNLVSMQFICTKISWPRHEIMLREVLPELSTICIAFTM